MVRRNRRPSGRLVQNKLRLRELGKDVTDALWKTLHEIAFDWEEKSRDEIQAAGKGPSNSTGRGALSNDIQSAVKRTAKGATVQMGYSATNHHGEVLHQGRRPGAAPPPFEAIALWVERKLRVSREDDSFYPIVQSIRKNIAKNGLKSIPAWRSDGRGGMQFFTNAGEENTKKWLGWLIEEVEKVAPDVKGRVSAR